MRYFCHLMTFFPCPAQVLIPPPYFIANRNYGVPGHWNGKGLIPHRENELKHNFRWPVQPV
jgi:hypothetical protein